jgi:UPF0271 protein
MKINLNADMGESFGAYQMGADETLIKSIQSANIACGFHGGDPVVMMKTLVFAKENDVSVGAHPSFNDLQGFGRRKMKLAPKELYAILTYQIGALMGSAQTMGLRLSHVKPHGAMNNMACEDYDMSLIIAKAVHDVDQDLILLAPVLSELSKAGKDKGLRVGEEIFADRAYEEDATLVARSKEGAVLHDPAVCLDRVLRMLDQKGIITQSGSVLACDIHSICVHGDNAEACQTAAFLKEGLLGAGYDLRRLDEMI